MRLPRHDGGCHAYAARHAGSSANIVQGTAYQHVTFVRTTTMRPRTCCMSSLEGDGSPWSGAGTRVSNDLTPHHPVLAPLHAGCANLRPRSYILAGPAISKRATMLPVVPALGPRSAIPNKSSPASRRSSIVTWPRMPRTQRRPDRLQRGRRARGADRAAGPGLGRHHDCREPGRRGMGAMASLHPAQRQLESSRTAAPQWPTQEWAIWSADRDTVVQAAAAQPTLSRSPHS